MFRDGEILRVARLELSLGASDFFPRPARCGYAGVQIHPNPTFSRSRSGARGTREGLISYQPRKDNQSLSMRFGSGLGRHAEWRAVALVAGQRFRPRARRREMGRSGSKQELDLRAAGAEGQRVVGAVPAGGAIVYPPDPAADAQV